MISHLFLDNKLGRANLIDHDLVMLDQHFTDRDNPWLLAVLEELQAGRDDNVAEIERLEDLVEELHHQDNAAAPPKPEVKF